LIREPVVDKEDAGKDEEAHVTGDFPIVYGLSLVITVDEGSVQRKNRKG
jgi:hypothetical protein